MSYFPFYYPSYYSRPNLLFSSLAFSRPNYYAYNGFYNGYHHHHHHGYYGHGHHYGDYYDYYGDHCWRGRGRR